MTISEAVDGGGDRNNVTGAAKSNNFFLLLHTPTFLDCESEALSKDASDPSDITDPSQEIHTGDFENVSSDLIGLI